MNSSKGNIDFQDFIAIMQKQREYVDSEDEILEAFRYLVAYLFSTLPAQCCLSFILQY